MPETSGRTLRRWLLFSVADVGGGSRLQVHDRVEQLFGGLFTREDRLPRVGRAGREPAWRNNLDSLYDRLKKAGVMVNAPARSPWQLTAVGQREAQNLVLAVAPPPQADADDDEEDLLRDFKPGTDRAYTTEFPQPVRTVRPQHEGLLESFGQGVVRHGWRLSTEVHPRDLVLTRGGENWLAEIKVVYDANVTHAARDALAQLFEYRHFLYAAHEYPELIAVFSEPVGDAFVAYLETSQIAVTWREGDIWAGSARAEAAQLIPRS